MPQPHTFASRYMPKYKPMFAKEYACLTQTEIHYFLSFPKWFNLFTNAQPKSVKHFYSRHFNDRDLQHDTDDRTPSANSSFASCGMTVVNLSAVFQFNFSAGLTALCPEISHERKAAKRQHAVFFLQNSYRK
jgi:hypothetical protein